MSLAHRKDHKIGRQDWSKQRDERVCVLFEDSDLTLSNKISAKEATKKSHTRVTRRCVSLYTKVPSSYCY